LQFFLIDIGIALAALVGYPAMAFWHNVLRDSWRVPLMRLHCEPADRILAEYAS
jgi:hypothetical protein